MVRISAILASLLIPVTAAASDPAAGASLGELVPTWSVIPFIIIQLAVLVGLWFWPELATWLPDKLKN